MCQSRKITRRNFRHFSRFNDVRERSQVASLVASRREETFFSFQPADYPGCDSADIDLLTAPRILVVVRTYGTGRGGVGSRIMGGCSPRARFPRQP